MVVSLKSRLESNKDEEDPPASRGRLFGAILGRSAVRPAGGATPDLGFRFGIKGIRVWGLGFRVESLGFRD